MKHDAYAYGDRLPQAWGMPARVCGPGHHVLACPKMAVAKLGRLLTATHIEALEHNQKIAHCCRHPEHHEVEAWFSCADEEAKGTPDIYIFHCTCGRQHRFFCVGGGVRPFWQSAPDKPASTALLTTASNLSWECR